MRPAILSIATSMIALCAFALPARAEGDGAAQKTMIVVGAGEASAAPDMAMLNIGVETEGATAGEALRKNAAQMEAAVKSLRDAGVDKKDIQTSNLSVGAKYDYSRNDGPPRIIGYEARNAVTVKIRDVAKAGTIIDKTVSVGANRLDSISFGFTDPKSLSNKARKAAVEDAKERAALYADAAGVKLGAILQISESASELPGPRPMVARMAESAKSIPIETGESSISASVTVIYAIE
jgi:uncharacterized protein YggE